MSAHVQAEDFDVEDPTLTRFDLVKEGARRDGVEIVHYVPRFPVPGTKREKRTVRTIAMLFLLAGLLATAFVVAYIAWPWNYQNGFHNSKLYTPILGATMGLSLLCIGVGMISWGKKLLPEEIAVQERHEGGSAADERKITGQTMLNMVDELGVKRRPLLGVVALAGMAPLGAVLAAPLVGGLIQSPHHNDGIEAGPILFRTGWDPTAPYNPNPGAPIALARQDGTKIRPEDVSVGGQMTVFPGIYRDGEFVGASNDFADSPTLLIHLRDADAQQLTANLVHVPPNLGFPWGSFVAYSKICTHAGCPASLYEQQTNRLLCPCHQSQFNILDNARPIFGPATRHLPMLPLAVDADGFFVAGIEATDGTITPSDYKEPIGPGFWER
jgi:ubiquinol-cytochrome c reductase iron-sulfur subunit